MTDLAEMTRTDGPQRAAGPFGRPDATSDATRLLCAGTYLSDSYRAAVIRELYLAQYRYVAPSYGYDVVPILGHALAAHRLRGLQLAATLTATAVCLLLTSTGALNPLIALMLLWWACWGAAFLARVSTLESLMKRLRPAREPDGFDGSYPQSSRLTDERVRELTEQQRADRGVVYYGGYKPFVGAGVELDDWSTPVLLVPERPNPLFDLEGDQDEDGVDEYGDAGADDEDEDDGELIAFTVREITDYVAEQLHRDLVADPEPNERIEGLVIERRKFARAIAKHASGTIDARVDSSQLHWEESYDAAREYLCVRIGSWQQELVTSIFVGFDIRGNTLHMEFHPYVLLPIRRSFHLVDRLPDRMSRRLLARVARDTLFALPFEVLSLLLHPLALRLPAAADVAEFLDRKVAKRQRKNTSFGDNAFGLARYAEHEINRGANTSVRELAAQDRVQHFFQYSDLNKYRGVVERSLLRSIETFLEEHNVDLTDFRGAQSNILYQSIGNVQADGDVTIDQGVRARRRRTERVRPQGKKGP